MVSIPVFFVFFHCKFAMSNEIFNIARAIIVNVLICHVFLKREVVGDEHEYMGSFYTACC